MKRILGDNGDITQMDEDDIKFFAIPFLHTINTRYFDRPLSILESVMDVSDSIFILLKNIYTVYYTRETNL
jgi:hypothetical protein